MNEFNLEELADSLIKYRELEGRCWKSKLRADWFDGNYYYPHRPYVHLLQRFRNMDGVNTLTKIKADMTKDEILRVLNK